MAQYGLVRTTLSFFSQAGLLTPRIIRWSRLPVEISDSDISVTIVPAYSVGPTLWNRTTFPFHHRKWHLENYVIEKLLYTHWNFL